MRSFFTAFIYLQFGILVELTKIKEMDQFLPRLRLFVLDLEVSTSLGARVVDFAVDDVTIGVMMGRCGTMTGRTTLLSLVPIFTFKTTRTLSCRTFRNV